jgi:hypothetical protein
MQKLLKHVIKQNMFFFQTSFAIQQGMIFSTIIGYLSFAFHLQQRDRALNSWLVQKVSCFLGASVFLKTRREP